MHRKEILWKDWGGTLRYKKPLAPHFGALLQKHNKIRRKENRQKCPTEIDFFKFVWWIWAPFCHNCTETLDIRIKIAGGDLIEFFRFCAELCPGERNISKKVGPGHFVTKRLWRIICRKRCSLQVEMAFQNRFPLSFRWNLASFSNIFTKTL